MNLDGVNKYIEQGRRGLVGGALGIVGHVRKGLREAARRWIECPYRCQAQQGKVMESFLDFTEPMFDPQAKIWKMVDGGAAASNDTPQCHWWYCTMETEDRESSIPRQGAHGHHSSDADDGAYVCASGSSANGTSQQTGRSLSTADEEFQDNEGQNSAAQHSVWDLDLSNAGKIAAGGDSEITCCRFSLDGKQLVQGTSGGHILAWDVSDGKCLFRQRHLEHGAGRPVLDCCFLSNGQREVALSVHDGGDCVAWTIIREGTGSHSCKAQPFKLREEWGLSPTFERATFSSDGTRLLCVVRNKEMELTRFDIFVFNTSSVKCSLKSKLSRVEMRSFIHCSDNDGSISEAHFSPSGRGIAVGIRQMTMPQSGEGGNGWGAGSQRASGGKGDGITSRVAIWPDYELEPLVMHELQGTLCCWSADSSLLATWNSPLGDRPIGVVGEVLVWDVASLVKEPGCTPREDKANENGPGSNQQLKAMHPVPREDSSATLLLIPDWCSFLSADLLVTCTVNSGYLDIVVWDALSGVKLHSIGNELHFQGTQLECKGFERCSLLGLAYSRLPPLAVSVDRRWLACYCQSTNVGYVWDAEVNSKLLKFRLPKQAMSLNGGFHLVFAKTANLLALVGKQKTLTIALDHTIALVPKKEEGHLGLLGYREEPGVLNYPDHKGLSALTRCIDELDPEVFDSLMLKASHQDLKVQLCFPPSRRKYKNVQNALALALKRRRPHAVRVVLKSILEELTNPYAASQIYQDSLVKLAKVYPDTFDWLLRKRRFMRKCHDGTIRRPESWLLGRTAWTGQFIVVSDDRLVTRPVHFRKDSRGAKGGVEEIWDSKRDLFYDPGLGAFIKERLAKSNYMEWEAKVIPVKHIAQIGKRGILRGLLLANVPPRLLSLTPIKCVIAYKWNTYAMELFLEEICHYSALLLFFTAYAVLLGRQGNFGPQAGDSENPSALDGKHAAPTLAFLFLSVAMAIMNLIREAQQLITYAADYGFKGLWYWTNSHWNWVELVSYVLLVTVIPPTHLLADDDCDSNRLSVYVAVEVILLWWKVLFFLQVFEPTAPMVIMVRAIVRDIRFFLVLAFSVMFGFSVAFYVIFRHNHHERKGLDAMAEMAAGGLESDERAELAEMADDMFGTLGRSMRTLYSTMLGEFDLDVMDVPHHSGVALTLYILYMITLMVILLNLLIAIMGNSFARIKQTEEEQFLCARAAAIDDVESMLSARRQREISKKIRRYLHVLVPKRMGYAMRVGTLVEDADLATFTRKTIKQCLAELEPVQLKDRKSGSGRLPSRLLSKLRKLPKSKKETELMSNVASSDSGDDSSWGA
eukprot:evm.model.scf_1652.1 EVM.evm.TU.scf_1652.1   scf_1652:9454-14514(+)